MSPLKQPLSLQKISIECSSYAILSYAIASQQYFYHLNWNEICIYVGRIPPKFMTDILDIALKKLSLYHLDYLRPDTVAFLLRLLLHPSIKKLSFSALANAGETSYDLLDMFENMLSFSLPYMPNLTHLDLSTHRTDSSLPSCSNDVLNTIGQHCPNLRVLDLRYNNRVTRDGLHCLAPAKYTGCPDLEEIYVQDCSLTRSDIIWLMRNFKCLKIIGYQDMGTILKGLKYLSHRSRRYKFCLTHFDNSESTCTASDGHVIRLVNKMCPSVVNLKVRICDNDCRELYNLNNITMIELRFYTGVYHEIGPETMAYFKADGYNLTSLTIYCAKLNSYHVTTVASNCVNLSKLFFCSKRFEEIDDSLLEIPNKMEKLRVLSIKIGLHVMDESLSADLLATYLIASCVFLQEIYLQLRCSHVDYNFLTNCLRRNSLSFLKIFNCDAPKINQDLPIMHLGYKSALLMIERCPQLCTIGNLISWSISSVEIEELQKIIKDYNLDIEIIQTASNDINKFYVF